MYQDSGQSQKYHIVVVAVECVQMCVYCVRFCDYYDVVHVCSISIYKNGQKSAKAKRRKTFQSFLRGIKKGDFLPCFSLTLDSLFYFFFVFDSIFADMFIVYCVDDGAFFLVVYICAA